MILTTRGKNLNVLENRKSTNLDPIEFLMTESSMKFTELRHSRRISRKAADKKSCTSSYQKETQVLA